MKNKKLRRFPDYKRYEGEKETRIFGIFSVGKYRKEVVNLSKILYKYRLELDS